MSFLTSWESPIQKAAWQLQQVCDNLPSRPISVWDSEYGCAPFILKTADIKADNKSTLTFKPVFMGRTTNIFWQGGPKKHGDKFKLNDPFTWSEVTQSIEVNHSKLGRVKVSLWSNLHFRKTATRPMSLIRVERLDESGNLRVSKPLWLAWVGEEMPPLEEVWQLYLQCFTQDLRNWHIYRKTVT